MQWNPADPNNFCIGSLPWQECEARSLTRGKENSKVYLRVGILDVINPSVEPHNSSPCLETHRPASFEFLDTDKPIYHPTNSFREASAKLSASFFSSIKLYNPILIATFHYSLPKIEDLETTLPLTIDIPPSPSPCGHQDSPIHLSGKTGRIPPQYHTK